MPKDNATQMDEDALQVNKALWSIENNLFL